LLFPHDHVIAVEDAGLHHAAAFDLQGVSVTGAKDIPAHRDGATVMFDGLDGLACGDAPDDRDLRNTAFVRRVVVLNDEGTGSRFAAPDVTLPFKRLEQIEDAGAL